MNYCNECGHTLELKELEHEGMIPYCEHCKEFRFPVFNTAVSMVVLNPDKNKILLIQQYGRGHNILVAGYVNKGEALEEAMYRELEEEIGIHVKAYRYMKSEYFQNSNTVICNFAVVADTESLENISDWEIDEAAWFAFDKAGLQVKPCSLAQRFLLNFYAQWELIKDTL